MQNNQRIFKVRQAKQTKAIKNPLISNMAPSPYVNGGLHLNVIKPKLILKHTDIKKPKEFDKKIITEAAIKGLDLAVEEKSESPSLAQQIQKLKQMNADLAKVYEI